MGFHRPRRPQARQLRFRRNFAPRNDPRIFDGTRQLVAVLADGHRSDNGDEIAISRPGALSDEVEPALAGWEDWATLRIADNGIDRRINLARIRDRNRAKDLTFPSSVTGVRPALPLGGGLAGPPFFLPAAMAAARPARLPKRPPLVAEIRSHSPLLPSAGSQSSRPGARPVNPRPRRTTQAE
ncbi:hypothetical protein MOKP64_15760 [Mycobacterium avium subsp. hominissuis]